VSDAQETRKNGFWSTTLELPTEVFEAWQKTSGAISPVAIVASVDPDGAPRTAPFGSLCAITPRLLWLCSLHDYDTYANLCRDGQAMVALVSPPNISVSVRGQTRVVKERMEHDEHFAVLEIDIEEVKNDMVYRIVIESGITISAREKHKPWYDAVISELEAIG
jgi:hypothetical protein